MAEAGDAVALWKMGEVYRHGDRKHGVVRDEKKGWELIERAAAAKSVVASYLIGRKDIKFSSDWRSVSSSKDRDWTLSQIVQPSDCIEFAEFELMSAEWELSSRGVRINTALNLYRRAVANGAFEPELAEKISWCLTQLGGEGSDRQPVVVIGKKKIRNHAYEHDTTLVNIAIAEGVERIGDFAFSECANLRSITIPSSVKEIGWRAFAECSNLTSVRFNEGLETIEGGAFEGCSALNGAGLPSTVTTVGHNAFRECTSLKSFAFPEKVKTIFCAVLRDCKSLQHIDIPTGITFIEAGAFEGCESLEQIELPSTVETIQYSAFEGCTSLPRINIPPLVTELGSGMFDGCKALEAIDIPSSVRSIDRFVFRGCERLKSITFHEGLTEIGDNAFEGCVGLTEVALPQSVVKIGDECFKGCGNLERLDVPEKMQYGGNVFGGCMKMPEVIIDGVLIHTPIVKGNVSITAGVRKIGDRAFEDCRELVSLEIPNTVTVIGNHAFNSCVELVSVTIPDSVMTIGYDAFSGCTGLVSVKIPDSVAEIGSAAFCGCTKLRSVVIPNAVRIIQSSMFKDCVSLETVSLPSGLKSIHNDAFCGCSRLKKISIPDGVVWIQWSAFAKCTSLESVEIPASVQEINSGAFFRCASLRNVTIQYGALKKPCKYSMCHDVFDQCVDLKHIALPCYFDYRMDEWLGGIPLPEIIRLNDPAKPVGQNSPEEMVTLVAKVRLEGWAEANRKRILSDIQEDISAGRTIAISELSARAQKQALVCGFLLTDTVAYKYEATHVMHCPCAMQIPALERMSVKVPRSMLSDGEPDYILVYLEEKRERNWIVLPTGETDEGVEKYASSDEAKASRFGALMPIILSARLIGKKR